MVHIQEADLGATKVLEGNTQVETTEPEKQPQITWDNAKEQLTQVNSSDAPPRNTRASLAAITCFENANIPLSELPLEVAQRILNARYETMSEIMTSWAEFMNKQAKLDKEASDKAQLLAQDIQRVLNNNDIQQPLRGQLMTYTDGLLLTNNDGSKSINHVQATDQPSTTERTFNAKHSFANRPVNPNLAGLRDPSQR